MDISSKSSWWFDSLGVGDDAAPKRVELRRVNWGLAVASDAESSEDIAEPRRVKWELELVLAARMGISEVGI